MIIFTYRIKRSYHQVVVLMTILRKWNRFPSLRLCQFLVNAADHTQEPNNLFYVSDATLMGDVEQYPRSILSPRRFQ